MLMSNNIAVSEHVLGTSMKMRKEQLTCESVQPRQ